MRKKASEIYHKLLKDEQAISDIDVYNEDVSRIIEIISNECKSTVVNEKGETRSYESVLKKDDIKELIIQFFKNSNIVNNRAIRDVMTTYYKPEEYIPEDQNETIIVGPILNTFLEKKLSQDGKKIEKIEIKSPIANDISECIKGKNSKQSYEIRKLVLEPYVENLINSNDELSSQYPIRTFFNKLLGRKKDTDQILQDYIEILSKDLEPEVAKNTATYIVKSLFMSEVFSKDMEEKAKVGNLIVVQNDKSKGYTGFKNQIVSEILDCANSQIVNPAKGLETINQVYSDILAQLKVMITSLENKEPEEIEKSLKEINKTILPNSKYHAENGYRNVEVRMSNRGGKIKVVPKRHTEKAMGHLTSYIAHVISNKDNMSKEEYIKEVSRIHYRFIRIHPFPDGNGRTGRAIINMMLEPIGESIVFNKEQKGKYIRALNFEHRRIDSEYKEKYLENLYENPEDCARFEEGSDYLLEEFIGKKVGIDYSDRAITEDLNEVIEEVKDFER